LDKKNWEGEARMEGILNYYKVAHQDVENFGEDIICFLNHPIP
jgi:hypothetical protein